MRPRDSKDRVTDAESTSEARASVATALRSSADGNDSRVSRVVAMVMSPAAPLAMGEASASGVREEDVVTAVDGAREALTEEQHAALARRIRLAMEQPGMDQTLLLGTPLPPALSATPSPAPAPPSSFIAPPPNPVPPASGERAPLSFKKTMLLGLPRLSTDASPAAPEATSSVASVRASVVRDVGPPRTPPPRRSRRGAAYSPDAVLDATDLAEDMDAELEPPDHDAFELDHRIVSPELALSSVARQAWPGLAPARVAAPPRRVAPAPLVRRAGLILPPPPGPRDRDPSSPELPTTDPFAGFIAPPPSLARRWASVMVIALAVVGAFALGALALRWLSHSAW